jgi:hypothetical protein
MKKTIAIAILLLFALYVQAQDRVFQITGFLEYDHISYFENLNGKINGRNQNTLQLDYKTNIAKSHTFFSSVQVRNDFSNRDRNNVYLKEGYFNLKFKHFDIRVGQQIITFGKTDGLNPTDVINPIDFTDILDTDDETLGVIALNTKWYFGDWNIQGILLPTFEPNILPTHPQNRWSTNLVDQIAKQGSFTVVVPTFLDAKMPRNDLRDAQFAFSLNGALQGVDFSAYYYKGYNHLPEIETSVTPINADTALAAIQQNFYKRQMIGGAFSTGIGYWGFRGEAALFIPENIQNDTSYLQYILGVDRTLTNVIGSNNIFIIVQWIHELGQNGAKFSNLDLNHLFQKTLMSRIEFELGTLTTLNVQAIYNIDYNDYLIQTAIERSLADGFNLTVRSDMLNGPKNSFFYGFNKNNRIQLILKYNF